ncbi:MAG: oligosaccharide flippase family protein [Bacteroidota bacterium]|nr:oligosaccharide flippase family protein [Bacteroidota bacterium]
MSTAIRDKIIRNTLYSIIGRIWTIIIGLLLIPYIVNIVGIERFGVWSLLSVLVGYFALLDFGVGVSYTRFIAEAYAQKNDIEINRIVNSGFVFYFFIAVPLFLISYFGQGIIFSFLQIDVHSLPDAVFAYYGVIILFISTAAMSGFSTILQGIQRIDITNKVAIVVTIPNVIATVYFLQNGFKLDGLLWATSISTMFGLVLSIYFAKKCLPSLQFNPLLFSWKTITRILPFGLKLQFAKLADIITFQTDRAFVSYFTGVSSVTYYHLGSQLNWRIRDIPLLLLTSLLPATSELHTLNEKDKLYNLYFRGTKYLAVIAIPLMLFIGTTSHLIMMVWMGPGYSLSGYISQILVVGYLINVFVGVGVIVAAGMNKPEYQLHSAILTSVVNIVLVIFCGKLWGIIGIAFAISISLMVGPVYFVVTFHRHIQNPAGQFLKNAVIKPLKAVLGGTIFFLVVNIYYFNSVDNRFTGGVILFLELVIFFSIYIFLLIKLSHFDDVDKELFMNNYLWSKFKNKWFHIK